VVILAVVGCVAVLALVATKRRGQWHRAARRPDEWVDKNPRAVSDSAEAQLTRLELAVDAIAIEVERIGENQRFLTKLLASEPRENARSAQDRREL
jgi:hypothetical protein